MSGGFRNGTVVTRVPVLPHRLDALAAQVRGDLLAGAVVVHGELLQRVAARGVATGVGASASAHRRHAEPDRVVAEGRALAGREREVYFAAEQPVRAERLHEVAFGRRPDL